MCKNSSWVLYPPILFFSKSSDSEQSSQSLGTVIVETSQKISPREDGGDQKETDQIKESKVQGKEITQTHPSMDRKTSKVYKTLFAHL